MTAKEIETKKARVEARNRKYEGFGKSASASEWAREFGLPRNTVWRYLQNGITPEEIAKIRGIEGNK